MDKIYNLFPNMSEALDSFLRGFLPGEAVDVTMALITIVLILLVLAFGFLVCTYLERKIVARIQDRWGPNRAGPWGIINPVADMIKMFTKEDIVPDKADKAVHLLAPILVAALPFIAFSVIPFGKGINAQDLDIGILFIIAVMSPAAIGILMAGWGSNNKYSLLGGMRAVAQLVSYEVPMALSILVVVMLTGSMAMQRIVEAQSGPGGLGLGWFVFAVPIGPIAFITYFIAAVAETNRSPFDIPEAESEIVAGYHTEYYGHEIWPVPDGRVCDDDRPGVHHHDALPGRLARTAAAVVRLVLAQGVSRSSSCSCGCAARCLACASMS